MTGLSSNEIESCLEFIGECEAGWEKFFREAGVVPIEVFYEDLGESFRETALRVLRYVEVTLSEHIDWVERVMQRIRRDQREVGFTVPRIRSGSHTTHGAEQTVVSDA